MKNLIAFFYLLTVSQIHMQIESEKLNVTILYEALCKDSINFIQNQLQPAYPYFEDFIHINFVPFGKSRSVNNGEYFECHHGPAECMANKIQSCALNEIQDEPSQVSFVVCQMSNNTDLEGRGCANKFGMNYQDISNCYSTELGTKLQLHAELITKGVDPKFVPTILYNSQFSQNLQNQSLHNFAGVLCALLKSKPSICFN